MFNNLIVEESENIIKDYKVIVDRCNKLFEDVVKEHQEDEQWFINYQDKLNELTLKVNFESQNYPDKNVKKD